MSKSVFIPAPAVDLIGAMISNIRDSNSPLAPSNNQVYFRNAVLTDPVVSISNFLIDVLYV